ncbi:MAG: hypothetical protein COV08_03050 [Candidatus Vogelbacteria bacterium CG10_big_fil_rev_8_21_14_0_10_49_38]|uniref:Uncharacterized protein n=1 Tax=Candidatus Vogelbacteria bacterium CG10_big_fil_rev_8_21_14_0_10_49_38 TaxID=1975043 RepID=A0A2H0RH81_9BACT|nr:MAG: hypothetical protein BK006_03060 [bacterium CG10_49_38]PIR45817.1 MAG: hypothetical protein COV08_03050 [Candidatus Vogelbacteria bacterium CG10_big_fil_rev_8_21_14_0_10_49_38]
MDPELKILVKENLEVTKENNLVLKKILGHQRWARLLGGLKWLLIIGSTVGVFYYFQPVFNELWRTYSELLGTVSDFSVDVLPGQN